MQLKNPPGHSFTLVEVIGCALYPFICTASDLPSLIKKGTQGNRNSAPWLQVLGLFCLIVLKEKKDVCSSWPGSQEAEEFNCLYRLLWNFQIIFYYLLPCSTSAYRVSLYHQPLCEKGRIYIRSWNRNMILYLVKRKKVS